MEFADNQKNTDFHQLYSTLKQIKSWTEALSPLSPRRLYIIHNTGTAAI